MAGKWIGGVVAVVAVFALAGQCAGADAEEVVSGAPAPTTTPTTAPAPIRPAAAAPVVTSAPRSTTSRPAPTTTRPAPTTTAPTTTPAPQPNPKPQPNPEPEPAPQRAVAASDAEDGDSSSVYFKNCTAARNAGAAPVRRGDPGYASRLDRDGDGVGCE
jgi:outer membrane biosynthesis protein TonB